MESVKKMGVVLGLLVLCACATRGGYDQGTGDTGQGTGEATAEAARVDCSTVRCAACPEGETPALKPPDCCRCVPIDKNLRDCSTVRCAACPEGQHPALTPPDCCRCVPD